MTVNGKTPDISQQIIRSLKTGGADFFMSVPCKLLANMIRVLEADNEVDYLPVTREEEGVGISAGAYLGGRTPCLLMQDSGLGNMVNAILSLVKLYHIPLIMVISYRGTPGEKVATQVPMALVTKDILHTLRVPVLHCHRAGDVDEITGFVEYARMAENPAAILVDFNFMEGGK